MKRPPSGSSSDMASELQFPLFFLGGWGVGQGKEGRMAKDVTVKTSELLK